MSDSSRPGPATQRPVLRGEPLEAADEVHWLATGHSLTALAERIRTIGDDVRSRAE